MKHIWKRITAFSLALAMALSLLSTTAWAVEAEEEVMDLPAAAEPVEEPETDDTLIEQPSAEEEPSEDAPEEELPTEEPEEMPEVPAEEVTETEAEAQEEETPIQTEEIITEVEAPVVEPDFAEETLTLHYDDRFDFSAAYKDYTVALGRQHVTSNQVKNRAVSDRRDTAVLTMVDDSKAVATGVGSAEVTLTSETEIINLTVTVEPADLTLMFLAGQSNMEGSCPTKSDYHPEQSVLCPEGQVYSTYIPTGSEDFHRSVFVTGIDDFTVFHNGREDKYVAGSLTGEQEVYPLNALTEQGKGKTGPDAGLAYRWNQLTGEKVWVINAAVGGSYSSSWKHAADNYSRGEKAFGAALDTAEAEVGAGHYRLRHRLLFWLQGEADWKKITTTADAYCANFRSMEEGFRHQLGIEHTGIISVRAHHGNDATTGELDFNVVRTAQYFMTLSEEYPNASIVSNVNEQWVTDAGVKSYFTAQDANKDGKLDYLTHNGRLSVPTTVTAVHPDIHYKQVGHNENGLTAAEGMYAALYGGKTPTSAKWRDAAGAAVTALSVKKGASAVVVAEIAPLSASKGVTFRFDEKKLSYDAMSGTLTAKEFGSSDLTLCYGDGTLATLTVTCAVPKPSIKTAENVSSGIKLTWGKSSGAKGYYVYRKKAADSKYTKLAEVTGTSYTDTTAANGTVYSYYIVAYAGSEKSSKSAAVTHCWVTAVKPSSLKNAKGKKMTVKWAKNSKATGYEVQYSLKSDFSSPKTVTVKGASKVSTTVSKLTKGKTYYVRVRAYKTDSKVNYPSAWSGSKKVKISK